MVLPSPVGESVAANLIQENPFDAFSSNLGIFCFLYFPSGKAVIIKNSLLLKGCKFA